jgi:predicted O-methyltransferase YrrM
VASEPYEGVERTIEWIASWRESRRSSWPYQPSPACERELHHPLGAPWPCPGRDEFASLWSELEDRIAQRGLASGRGAFGRWDDADSGLARVIWCLARHVRPEYVLETGVGRGLTTAVILEALERNGTGRLWSVDLPPLVERELERETGAAVVGRPRERWTLLRGSSRRLLPGLVRGMDHVDLFVHDSTHTARNVGFELGCVWDKLSPGGAVVVDDVEKNRAFGVFSDAHPDAPAVICAADDGRAMFGCQIKPR